MEHPFSKMTKKRVTHQHANRINILMRYYVEAVKTFVLDGDDFEEANEAYDTKNSGGDQ